MLSNTVRLLLMLPLLCSSRFEGFKRALIRLRDTCDFNATAILDVGANMGLWSKTIQREVFPGASMYLIEGNEHHRSLLMSLGYPYAISLVGARNGRVVFHKLKESTKSFSGASIYRETTAEFNGTAKTEQVNATITTIDELIVSQKWPTEFQVVKMDIQGAEVDAIKGGWRFLAKTQVLFTEASLMEYNTGSPGMLDLHTLLWRRGFELYDVIEVIRDKKSGIAFQVDLMWVRRSSSLWAQSCTGFPIPKRFLQRGSLII